MLEKIKKKLNELRKEKGRDLGKELLINIGIAAGAAALILIISGADITFMGILEWIVATPIFSVIVGILRLVLKFAHKFIKLDSPYNLIVDVVICGVVTMCIGNLFSGTTDGLSKVIPNEIQILITAVLDAAYIAFIIFLTKPEKESLREE